MAGDDQRGSLFRLTLPNQRSRVTNAELFFDLVFVFAVTQISHTLLGRFTPLGVLQVTLLFLAVWWVWVCTTWVTNWLDPDRTPVRILLFLLMLGGLVLSTSLPQAFESRGIRFGSTFAAMQVGRTIFLLVSIPRAQVPMRMNAVRMSVWWSTSALFWIAGGLAEGQIRLELWIVALIIEYLSPVARFWVPTLGMSSIGDWAVEGGHMAERCAGFIIIALGESIVVTGQPSPSSTGPARMPWDFYRRWSAALRCGGFTSTRVRKRDRSGSRDPLNRAEWRGWPIPICTCRLSPVSSSRRSPMNWY